MKFWDSSAIVPLLVDEGPRASLLGLLAEDPSVAAWWGTPVECVSAMSRREREAALSAADARAAMERLRALSQAWHEIVASEAVRTQAVRLLRMHRLRSADALQLAAALVAAEGEPGSLPFVCLDERLATAAEREGFSTLP